MLIYLVVLVILWIVTGVINAYDVLQRVSPVVINTHLRKISDTGVQKVSFTTFIKTKALELGAHGIFAGEAARQFIKGIL